MASIRINGALTHPAKGAITEVEPGIFDGLSAGRTPGARLTRPRKYYNLATDFYEFGWGQSFHFAPMGFREPLERAIARHEHPRGRDEGARGGVEDRRIAVSVDKRLGDRPHREPVRLGQHVARGLLVHLVEGGFPEELLAVEDLKQVELDVPEIALVVAHVTLRVVGA